MNKTCIKCLKPKPLSEFTVRKKGSKDGHCGTCKECYKIIHRKFAEKNKEEIRIRQQKYREDNKEFVTELARNWHAANKERINARKKIYREGRKDHIHARQKKWRETNRDRIREVKKEYRKSNKEKILEIQRKYQITAKDKISATRNKYETLQRELNTDYAVKQKIKIRIRSFYRSRGIRKSKKSEQLIGCNWQTVMKYLNSLGYKRGYHHLDHIIPLAVFNIRNKNHVKIALHYTNLQPLSPEENMKKRDNLPDGWEDNIVRISKIININHEPIINHIKRDKKILTKQSA